MKPLVSTLAVIGACSTAPLAQGQTTPQDLALPPQRPWALAPLLLDRPDNQTVPGTSGPTSWQNLMPRQQPSAPAPMPPNRFENQLLPGMNGQTTWQDLMRRQEPSALATMPPDRPANPPFPWMRGQTTWQPMARQQPLAPAPMLPNRPEYQPFPRMPTEQESWALSGGAYTTFRASNAMTLDQIVEQMLAHGVPASSAKSAAPQVLRALKSVPIRYGAAVVALGAGGWALYQHFFASDEKPVARGTLKSPP